MRQTACLVVNPIIIEGYASLFNCTTAVRAETQWQPLRKTLTSGFGLDDMSEFLCISVFGVASGPRVKFASCKSALNPPVVYSTDRSKAVTPVLVLLFVALWFILRGDLFYVLPCVILFLCFSVLLALRLPRLGKKELILVLFVRLFDLCLFGFVGFLFLLVSGKSCCLWLWHSLDFSLTFFSIWKTYDIFISNNKTV